MSRKAAARQETLYREARGLLRRLRLMRLAREVGRAWLVGSVPLKLIGKPDIDVHVLVGEGEPPGPDGPEVDAALKIARGLMERCGVRKLEVMRFLFRSAVKIGFDVRLPTRTWHIDVWVTSDRGNLGTGPTRWVRRRLTPRLRRAILKLKRYYAARDMCRYGMSHELYRAVIAHGVRTPRQFLEYARTHQLSYNDILRMLEADGQT
jgi:hypothetical protein